MRFNENTIFLLNLMSLMNLNPGWSQDSISVSDDSDIDASEKLNARKLEQLMHSWNTRILVTLDQR